MSSTIFWFVVGMRLKTRQLPCRPHWVSMLSGDEGQVMSRIKAFASVVLIVAMAGCNRSAPSKPAVDTGKDGMTQPSAPTEPTLLRPNENRRPSPPLPRRAAQ